MAEFKISVVERHAVRTAGMKVRTNMINASRDCTALWSEKFGSQREAFPADPKFPGESFGVSVMLDRENFDYWAVMPLAEGTRIPDGMEVYELAGGLYAECLGITIPQLGDVFNYLYMTWQTGPDAYALANELSLIHT
mgnify:CR=1 FL=1